MKTTFRLLVAGALALLLFLAGAALADEPFIVRTDRNTAAHFSNDSFTGNGAFPESGIIVTGNITQDGQGQSPIDAINGTVQDWSIGQTNITVPDPSGAGTETEVRPAAGTGSGTEVGPAAGTGSGTEVGPAAGTGNGTEVGPAAGTGNSTVVGPVIGTGNSTVVGPVIGTGNGTVVGSEPITYLHSGIFGNFTTDGQIMGSVTIDLLDSFWGPGQGSPYPGSDSPYLPQQLCHASPLEKTGYTVNDISAVNRTFKIDLNGDGQNDIYFYYDMDQLGGLTFQRLSGADRLTRNYTLTYAHPGANVFYNPITINICRQTPTPTPVRATDTPAPVPSPTSVPTATPTPVRVTDTPAPAIVSQVSVNGAVYRLNHKTRTAAFTSLANQKMTALSIPASVKANGKSYAVTVIAAAACKKAPSLTRVAIGKRVRVIETNAFYGAKKLTLVTGGAAVTEIGNGAFAACVKLKKLPVLPGLKTIGANAFNGCKSLTSVSLCAKVKKIGRKAFCGCAALKKITVKSSLLKAASVGTGAFKGIFKKAVFVCPEKRRVAYHALFLKKGAPKTCLFK